ncbi:MAG: hypothetical protein PHN22_03900 [Candidatus ainarchaeum sp.]|nr:hypothetical protein [Candidatus ainarchaeum sp.]
MGRLDYLNKIRSDIKLCDENYIKSNNRFKKIKCERLLQNTNYKQKYPLYLNFDLEKRLIELINNKKYNFTFFDIIKFSEKHNEYTNYFLDVAHDLIKIKELSEKKEINDFTYKFVLLSLYSNNFDYIINYLKPTAKAIQSTNSNNSQYKKETRNGSKKYI